MYFVASVLLSPTAFSLGLQSCAPLEPEVQSEILASSNEACLYFVAVVVMKCCRCHEMLQSCILGRRSTSGPSRCQISWAYTSSTCTDLGSTPSDRQLPLPEAFRLVSQVKELMGVWLMLTFVVLPLASICNYMRCAMRVADSSHHALSLLLVLYCLGSLDTPRIWSSHLHVWSVVWAAAV